ncbi:MAG: hypothetical protein AUJ75_01525 [Candidatus Omnitrophica bacterium CG1_02_49_10]|nr:MAG: hypothetical protein AUJ75_01525 [Candidatus Omnitrophica bacterium CG1_02_49_10]
MVKMRDVTDFDKRKFMRFETSVDAKYKIPADTAFHKTPSTKDLSKEGVCIYTYEPLPPGTALDIELALPGDRLPLSIRGLAVWSRRDEAKSDKYRTGVLISAIDGFDRSRMLDFAYSRWVETIQQ